MEKDPEVINLFNKYIYPQFKIDKPLHIIEGDAFDYYNEEFLSQYDYTYVDFWESNDDGLNHYVRLCKADIFRDNIDYWIEDTILYDVQITIWVYLKTLLDGGKISDLILGLDDESHRDILKKINRYFKSINITVSNEDELLELINNKDILRKILGQ